MPVAKWPWQRIRRQRLIDDEVTIEINADGFSIVVGNVPHSVEQTHLGKSIHPAGHQHLTAKLPGEILSALQQRHFDTITRQ